MESFKEYHLLTEESTAVSTALETVLGVAYQAAWQKGLQNQQNFLKAGMKVHAKDFKTAKKYWEKGSEEQQIKNLLSFGNKIVRQIGGNGAFETQTGGALTTDWKRWGGVNNTSKTDIVVGGKNCSVKNANGAQLMSAKKGEAQATTNAAAIMAGLANRAQADIVGALEKLEQQTTVGYYASVEHLKILKSKGAAGQTIFDYATQEKQQYEKDLAAWEALGPKALKKDKPKKPIQSILKIADNPEKAALQPTVISDVNKTFLKNIETKFQQNANEALNILQDTFKKDPNFKLAFVYEAASGRYKFGRNAVQTANYMLCWKPSPSGVQDFKIKVHSLGKGVRSPIVKEYAGKIDVQVNWKSSSTSKHLGYNAYQNLRLGVKEVVEKQKEQVNEHYSEVYQYRQQLNEGLLNEFTFWDKVKELTNKFVEKAKALWRSFIAMFRVAIQKIKVAAQDGLEALSNVLGFEMITHTNADQNIRIRI